MRLKITMREAEEVHRRSNPQRSYQSQRDQWAKTVRAVFKEEKATDTPAFGSNEGTIRFLFAPEDLVQAI
jgi:hypothetical protein